MHTGDYLVSSMVLEMSHIAMSRVVIVTLSSVF